MARKEKFQYNRRAVADTQAVRDSSGYTFRPLIVDGLGINSFRPEPSNLIRLLPPTWDQARHLALETWVHYGIGSDQDSYICPHQMDSIFAQIGIELPVESRCAVCTARGRAQDDGEGELADDLRPTKRWAGYVINRNKLEDGIIFWAMPHTLNKSLATSMLSEQEAGIISIDDPYEGYDVSFAREGTGKKTKYVGLTIARKQTPLSTDERLMDVWLEKVVKNPIPKILRFYPYEEIERALRGQKPREDEDTRTQPAPEQPSREPDVAQRPATTEPDPAPPEDKAYNPPAVDDLSRTELITFINKEKLSFSGPLDDMGRKELVDIILKGPDGETQGNQPPPPESPAPRGNGGSRLDSLREKYGS